MTAGKIFFEETRTERSLKFEALFIGVVVKLNNFEIKTRVWHIDCFNNLAEAERLADSLYLGGKTVKLYVNGTIYSENESGDRFTAMAVEGKHIARLGESGDLLRAYPDAEVVDLKGRTVLPGLIESHVHLLNYAYSLTKIDCTAMKSIAELIQQGRNYIRDKAVPAGTWVQGRGWNQTFFEEGRNPTVADLDAISTEHPIVYGGDHQRNT